MRSAIASRERTASSGVNAQVRNCNASSAGTRSPRESICRTRRANVALADIARPSYLVCYLRKRLGLKRSRKRFQPPSPPPGGALNLCPCSFFQQPCSSVCRSRALRATSDAVLALSVTSARRSLILFRYLVAREGKVVHRCGVGGNLGCVNSEEPGLFLAGHFATGIMLPFECHSLRLRRNSASAGRSRITLAAGGNECQTPIRNNAVPIKKD